MFKQQTIFVRLFSWLSITLIACASNQSNEPEKVIQKIYATPNPFRNENLDVTLFSDKLYQLISAAKLTEKKSRESILHSKTPTDKPIIVEGEIFASLYEGYSGWEILGKQQKADTMSLTVEFTHIGYQQVWKDQLVCIRENGNWKFDNVIYGKPTNLPNLQAVLSERISMGNTENIIQ